MIFIIHLNEVKVQKAVLLRGTYLEKHLQLHKNKFGFYRWYDKIKSVSASNLFIAGLIVLWGLRIFEKKLIIVIIQIYPLEIFYLATPRWHLLFRWIEASIWDVVKISARHSYLHDTRAHWPKLYIHHEYWQQLRISIRSH